MEDSDSAIIETDLIFVARKENWPLGADDEHAEKFTIHIRSTGGIDVGLLYPDSKKRDDELERIGYMVGAR